MKQTAEEIRAVKDKMRAARTANSKIISLNSNEPSENQHQKGSEPDVYCKRSQSSHENSNRLIKNEINSKVSTCEDPTKHSKPRWNLPARDLRDSERTSGKEIKFMKLREKKGGYLLEDEIDTRQQKKLCLLRKSQSVWWEQEQRANIGKVLYAF